MKRIIPLAGILAVAASIVFVNNSCKKSSSNNNPSNNGMATQSIAQKAYDNQSGGVYKGSLTGSSGYFEVNLQASKPFLIYQWTNPAGSIDSLFTNSLGSWQSGVAISKAVFTGADGSVFWFSVNADGSNPTIDSVYIPGHTAPVYAALCKELSKVLVKVYQGTGTPVNGNGGGCVSATVNFWTTDGFASGTYLGTNGDHGGLAGSISGTQISVTGGNNNSETGTLTISADGNTISGTVNGRSCSHTVSLTRIF